MTGTDAYPDIFPELRLEHSEGRFADLKTAVESSYRSLECFRELYRNLVENYAGPAYGDPKDKRDKYINKMSQAVDAWTMLLAANRPACDVSTKQKMLSPFAIHFEAALNDLFAEIGLEYTVRRWVLDAFFCVGVVRVHLKDSAEVQFENNLWMDPGTPFASNVSPFDFVCDMTCKSWPEVKYAGNMYQITLLDLQDGVQMGMYDMNVAGWALVKARGGEGQDDRLEYLTRDVQVEEYNKTVDLCDVWVARDKKIYTFVVTDRNKFCFHDRPIAEMDWEEPDCGPYHILGFHDVPDNIMPVSPASHLDSLDRLINSLYRKAARQAQRQKENPTFAAGADKDANRLKKANDGEWIHVQDPLKIGVYRSAGADPGNVAFLQGAIADIDMSAGNLPGILGLAQQGDTLGQEQLIQAAGSRKFGQMQYRVLDATRKLIRSLGFMLWTDEFKEIVATIPVTADYEAPAYWQPGDREGNFLDYNFDINVHSMTYRPPAAQVDTVNQLLTNIYIPLAELGMQQGTVIDLAYLAQKQADLLGIDWLTDVVKSSAPPESDKPGPSTGVARKSPVTTRNEVRRSTAQPQASGAQQQQRWQQMASQGRQSGFTPIQGG